MYMILKVTNKALEGLDMVNPRQSNAGGIQSGDYDSYTFPFHSPGGASLNL